MSIHDPFDHQTAFTEIANGDESAKEFCEVFLCWVHMIDDAVDRDNPLDPALFVDVCFKLAEMATDNQFFHENRESLMVVIQQGCLAYEQSCSLEVSSDPQERRVSQVLKSIYQQTFWQVAFITGGFEHMRQMAFRYSRYHFDVE